MAKQLFLNNWESVFIASVKDTPVTGTPATELDYGILRLSDGASATLINPTGGDYYVLTALKRSGSIETNIEIMRVTAVDNGTPGECRVTVSRAQEGTTAKAFVSGDFISLRATAGGLNSIITTTESIASHVASTANPHSVTKAQVGLGNVDNTSDANKPVSTAQQDALNLKANLASPTFTGTVGGITKSMVGLGNVDNTTDLAKPVSTAQQTALNLKRNLTETVVVTSGAFTATAGNVYVLTGSSTLTLPASPSAGNWVSVVNRSGLLTCTVTRNGQNIMGLAEDMTLDNLNASLTLVFADATRGWVWA